MKTTKKQNKQNSQEVLNAVLSVFRKSNAKDFIATLNMPFTEKQFNELTELLAKYEQYLDENN